MTTHKFEESGKEYALIDLDDGRKARVWSHYFRHFGIDVMSQLESGDRISIKKVAYNCSALHTAWEVTALPIRLMMRLPDEIKRKLYNANRKKEKNIIVNQIKDYEK